ncbi:BglG family transcription antiterminator [Sporosalibacterium faouarense]|uniref:BglG family transcription antiterminator n=1 Tax=Sporosalibacterium faouarense TaxID=516123 RepID=UPI00192B9BC0|nr:transcription antiterminator [Sporosalibacterium faouarense]
MIQLTLRQRQIIEDLLNQTTPVSAKDLADKFNISVRTIRYDLDSIEDWLKSHSVSLMKKPNVGIWVELSDDYKESIKNKIEYDKPDNKVLSKNERHHHILLELLKTINPITAEYLSNILGVSRTTVMKDLKDIKKELKRYDIGLKSKQRVGYMITGNEKRIRKFIGDILLNSLNRHELLEIIKLVGNNQKRNEVSFDIEALKGLSSKIDINDIKKAVKSGRKVCDFSIPDSSYISLLVHITIAVDRLLKGQQIELAKDKIASVKEQKEYMIASEIGKSLSEIFDVKVPDAEIANITIHLISSNLKLKYLYNEDFFLIQNRLDKTIEDMIKEIKEYIGLNDYNMEKLKADLLSHLKLTLKKYDLNIIPENPLINEIKANYTKAFDLAKKMATVFHHKMEIELPESEIGYIALHLAAQLEVASSKVNKKALVVCTTGKGSAKILAVKLKNNIPELEIKDTVSIFELEDKDYLLDDVDFAISTINIKTTDKPVIKVSPLISNAELNRIKDFVYKGKVEALNRENEHKNYMLESIMNVIDKYISREDKPKLRTELGYVTDFFINSSNKVTKESSITENFSRNIATILVEIGNMIIEITSKDSMDYDLSTLWGVIVHVVMAVPRWEAGEFNREVNIDKYRKENKELFNTVRKTFNLIGDKYDFRIPDSEVVAIIRYLI